MKTFHCDHCGQLLFFENFRCVNCGHQVAFLPDLAVVGSLDQSGDEWTSPLEPAAGRTYRLCQNYTVYDVCNWAIEPGDAETLCRSCRLTRVIPNLDEPGNKAAWYKLEAAKRRLIYTLLALGLPLVNRDEDPERGLAFEFLADSPEPDSPKVVTGHASGVITISVAEADDAERERRRMDMKEPYRTLLGHFRHETGHYYWDVLVAEGPRLEEFRKLFGDERQDYGEALARHHASGPPADWQSRFVSAYASSHPWEDWAETWAHYLHVTDTLETAAACGLALRPRRPGDPKLRKAPDPVEEPANDFDRMMESWYPLTYVLNNLNRGLGLPDGYPFVLSNPAVEKLRFVHEVVMAGTSAGEDLPWAKGQLSDTVRRPGAQIDAGHGHR